MNTLGMMIIVPSSTTGTKLAGKRQSQRTKSCECHCEAFLGKGQPNGVTSASDLPVGRCIRKLQVSVSGGGAVFPHGLPRHVSRSGAVLIMLEEYTGTVFNASLAEH